MPLGDKAGRGSERVISVNRTVYQPKEKDGMGRVQKGYLVLADISGFTEYLAGVELDHAHAILSELLELVIQHFKPVLALSHVEGDAVLAYTPEAKVRRGETLVELLEATYVAFRDSREAMCRRTTCTCRACQALPMLDLKFMVHHGDYLATQIAGREELVGLDVNLVRHRSLKEPVQAATGWRGYVLFTAQALERLRLDPDELAMYTQTGHFAALGELRVCSLDLHDRYQELAAARRAFVQPQEADMVIARDFAAPPAVVWEWLNDPHRRSHWGNGMSWRAMVRPGGRTGPGAQNHCVHGTGTAVETVLDWRPFDYFTVAVAQARTTLIQTAQLEPLPGADGTRLQVFLKLKLPLPRWCTRPLCRLVIRKGIKLEQAWERMARLMAEEKE